MSRLRPHLAHKGLLPAPESNVQQLPSAPKRRRVRRGTSSCWECRHRKVRCTFVENSTVCISCTRRGSECVSQEFQINPAGTRGQSDVAYHKVAQSLLHVEGLINGLLDQVSRSSSSSSTGKAATLPLRQFRFHQRSPSGTTCAVQPGPALPREIRPQLAREELFFQSEDFDRIPSVTLPTDPTASEPSPPSPIEPGGGIHVADPGSALSLPPTLPDYHSISHHVHSLMPSLGSALAILRRAKYVYLPMQMIQRPYREFVESSVVYQPADPFTIPEPTAHPILIARRFIQIALGLQQLHEDSSSDTRSSRLLRAAREASRRYFDAATRYVTSQDPLVASDDGIETLMLEGLYQINSGNLPLGWMAFRRAIGIAQLMKLPLRSRKEGERQGSNNTQALTKSQFLWFRLNYGDQPQFSDAHSIYTAATASRDVLSRFILYRKFNQVPSCCRAVDFKALTASATLLLAHLDGHRLDHANGLAHQRLQDLGLVQMAVESIEGLVRSSPNSQGETGLRVLKGLQEAEARAADSVAHSLCIDGWASGGECHVFEEGSGLEFAAPYLGRVRIAPLEVPAEGSAALDWLLVEQFGAMPSTSASRGSEQWPPMHSKAPSDAVPSLAGFSVMATLWDEVGGSVPNTTLVSPPSLAAQGLYQEVVPGRTHRVEYMDTSGLGSI
ncbi:hypothetical protein AUP68_15550 [Ilyonectria robusta]